jgi:hypothetical protein
MRTLAPDEPRVLPVEVRGSCSHTFVVRTERAAAIPFAGDAAAESHGLDQRARFRCPECLILATVTQRVTKRRCACGTWLNRYNRDDECGACAHAAAERMAAQVERRADQAATGAEQIEGVRRGSLAARVLAVLPGNVPEIAERIGEPQRRVQGSMGSLLTRGLVVSDGAKGRAGGQPRAVYSLACNDPQRAVKRPAS